MSQIENHTYDELQVGDEATLIRRLTIDDLRLFAGGSARLNPEHMDADAARSDLYHKAIANGMWGAGLVATLVTTEMPGPGTEFIDQHLTHLRPVSIGETVTVTVRVHEKQGDRQVMLDCQCVNEHGEDVLRGIYIVRAPTEKLSREHTQISPAEAELQTKGRQRRQLKRLLDLAHDLDPILTAVVHPVDALSLEGWCGPPNTTCWCPSWWGRSTASVPPPRRRNWTSPNSNWWPPSTATSRRSRAWRWPRTATWRP